MRERTYRVAMMFAGDPSSRATLKLEETRLGDIAKALRNVGLDVEAAVYADEVADGVREQLLRVDGVLVWVDPVRKRRQPGEARSAPARRGEPRRVRERASGPGPEDGHEGSPLSDSHHELGHRHAALYDAEAIPRQRRHRRLESGSCRPGRTQEEGTRTARPAWRRGLRRVVG